MNGGRHLREEPDTEARGLNEISHEISDMVKRMEQGLNYNDLERLYKKKVPSRALSGWLRTNGHNDELATAFEHYKHVKDEVNDVVEKEAAEWTKRLTPS